MTLSATAANYTPAPAAGFLNWRRLRRFPWLMTPIAAFYLLFFGVPLAQMVWQSIWNESGFTLHGYIEIMRGPGYWKIMGYTFLIGVGTLAIVLATSYPVAYWLVRRTKTWVVICMAFVLVPFWSSGLVRTYAWTVILGRQGIVNTTLLELGVIDQPFAFIGTHTAVIVGLAYYLLPYMILCLYSAMNGIDRNLMKAAMSLGASPLRAFMHVFVPLTKPGVFAGSFLVFMLAIGMYITPALLGGPEQVTLPLVIALQINEALDWTLAAALSVVLLMLTGVIQVFSNRFVDFDRMWGGAR